MYRIIYGTGNQGKLGYMKRALAGLPLELVGLMQAAEERQIVLPNVEENGTTPLENAVLKARAYYEIFHSPLFSCDSGLYLWKHTTGEPLPDKEQPGACIRGRADERLTDEQLLAHYRGLVRKYGVIRARYQNAICLIWNTGLCAQSDEEALWGESFLLTDVPHSKRVPGFPLDSISIEPVSGKYFYDREENGQDALVSGHGFRQFFEDFLTKNHIL